MTPSDRHDEREQPAEREDDEARRAAGTRRSHASSGPTDRAPSRRARGRRACATALRRRATESPMRATASRPARAASMARPLAPFTRRVRQAIAAVRRWLRARHRPSSASSSPAARASGSLPLTRDRAKPAVPFGGRYRIDRLRAVELRQLRHLQAERASRSTRRARSCSTWRAAGSSRRRSGHYVAPVPAADEPRARASSRAAPTPCSRTST